MKKVGSILLWLWQIPQHLLALIICFFGGYFIYYGEKFNGKTVIYSVYFKASFSLGDYLFIVPNSSKNILRHELGHSYQSQILGILYLPIIGIPSIIHNIYCRIARKLGYNPNYYSFYTEKWANNLLNKIG